MELETSRGLLVYKCGSMETFPFSPKCSRTRQYRLRLYVFGGQRNFHCDTYNNIIKTNWSGVYVFQIIVVFVVVRAFESWRWIAAAARAESAHYLVWSQFHKQPNSNFDLHWSFHSFCYGYCYVILSLFGNSSFVSSCSEIWQISLYNIYKWFQFHQLQYCQF